MNPTDQRRAMYKRGSVPGQIDHPGWRSKVVETAEAFDQALADGWAATMGDPVAATVPSNDIGPESSADERRDDYVKILRGRRRARG